MVTRLWKLLWIHEFFEFVTFESRSKERIRFSHTSYLEDDFWILWQCDCKSEWFQEVQQTSNKLQQSKKCCVFSRISGALTAKQLFGIISKPELDPEGNFRTLPDTAQTTSTLRGKIIWDFVPKHESILPSINICKAHPKHQHPVDCFAQPI